MPQFELKIRLSEFSEGSIIMENDEFPSFIDYDEYVRQNIDKIKFVPTDKHWRITEVEGVKVKKEEK